MVATAGSGPEPLPPKKLTAALLAEGIHFCLTAEAKAAATAIADRMVHENGVHAAVQSFHRHLEVAKIQCDMLPDQPAVWNYKKSNSRLKLSKVAAATLTEVRSDARKHMKW